MPEIRTNHSEPASSGRATPFHPAQVLINLVIMLLAPMFLPAAGGDIAYARAAAVQTVESYRAETGSDILAIAQIIAFGLAALGSLSLSMADDLPLPMMLRLRGNANACNRSAQQLRAALKENRPEPAKPAAPPPDPATIMASKLAKKAAEAAPAAPPPMSPEEEKQYWAVWAGSTSKVAAELAADLPNLPPEERRSAELWIQVLNDCSRDFRSGNTLPRIRPGDLAAALRAGGA